MDFVITHLDWVLFCGGLVGLFLGGEALIRGSVAVADRLRLPKLLVGLTIVGFGTSAPELLVSLNAAKAGAADVAIGNIVGSNIANILLIAGLGALIRPTATRAPGVRRDATVMVLATLAFAALAWYGNITQREGLIMVITLAVFLMVVFLMDRKVDLPQTEATRPLSMPLALGFIVAGLTALIFGADALVRGATSLATNFGVPQAVIGLTLVAVGTSLPELTVSVISAIKGHNELALGNIIGSNLFNTLAVLGITAALSPLAISPTFLRVDLPLMVAAALLLWWLILAKPRLGRVPALGGLIAYGGYITWLALGTA
ncbi:sodium/calcium exchanger family protein [Asticcacaulis biprosthecium C19]|uniref:Sodium/calcium exchanger family protein n=1 Tax=Asticcacaulis biprosthecium C19 TaxID=715226 RepID=F4QK71_9CAUL|nr:calcium/sodium antiporter [Asticcacaulis biprosthecium]EGF93249.1 sodium/calcium exchanger family protein [Asticcacaulis biprosthecium C19]